MNIRLSAASSLETIMTGYFSLTDCLVVLSHVRRIAEFKNGLDGILQQ